jgi:type IV pilus secretin PilQ/predicted competence protein
VSVCATLAIGGCAPPALDGPEHPAKQPQAASNAAVEESEPVTTTSAGTTADATRLQIREIKVIDDNGQQGLFTKLSRPPQDVTHFTLGNPNRVLIEFQGGTGPQPTAKQYRVDNPVIESIRVGTHASKTRMTITLKGQKLPAYTVNDLNDTLIVFIGEPSGNDAPVREQVVYTQRPQPDADTAPAAAVARTTKETLESLKFDAAFDRDDAIAEGAGARRDYYGQPVSLDLKDADVHNVLRLLAEVSKLNIVATDDVAGKVTLRLFDVPWDQALDIVLQVMNLESVQEGNVIRISTVRRLREEREELRRAQEAAREVEPLQVVYVKVNYAKAQKLGEMIGGRRGGGGSGSGQAGASSGSETGVLTQRGSVLVDEFTNTLVIRDIERGVSNARELVRRLDVQTPQILIESRIVEANSNLARDLGVQWGYRASVGPQTGTSTGANFPGTVGFGGSGLGTGAGGLPFIADFPAMGNLAAGNGSALDLMLGSLDGVHSLDVRISALEEKGQAKIISRPRVVTLNNVAATIKSLTVLRIRLPSTGTVISTGAGGSAGSSQSATEKIETGIILTVTPQVSSDGFVMLDMFAKSSQADFTRTVDNIPTEITREASSHVLIRDGETVVLGGIYRDQQDYQTRGIPFLKDIPGIGWLFRANSRNNRREDLLVFMTPRIVGGTRMAGGQPSAAELWERRDDASATYEGEPG